MTDGSTFVIKSILFVAATAATACVGVSREDREVASENLPATSYQVEVDGAQAVWLDMPGGQGNTATKKNLGNLITLKKGVTFYYWDSPSRISEIVTAGGVTTENMNGRILHPGQEQSEGGGLYMASQPADTAGLGSQALVFQLPHDVLGLKTSWTFGGDKTDVVLALRKAGITAIQEANAPTVFSFTQSTDLGRPRVLKAKEALSYYAAASRYHAIAAVFFLDQRMSISGDDLPAGFEPSVRNLLSGEEISEADKQVVIDSMVNEVLKMIDFFHGDAGQIKKTSYFNSVDAIVKEKAGVSLVYTISGKN